MKTKKAFTLLEILLVTALLAIMAGIVIFAINPQKQLANTRNAERLMDVNTIHKAINQYLIDYGSYPGSIASTSMEICRPGASDCTGLLDLSGLTSSTKYLVDLPRDPRVANANGTGYYVCRSSESRVMVFSPLAELNYEIKSGSACAEGGATACDESQEFCGFSVCGDTGDYQGKSYETASINGYCSLKAPLNIGTQICAVGTTCAAVPDDTFDVNNVEKYCYNNDENNCTVYGALYSWAEGLGLPNKCNVEEYACNGTDCQALGDSSCTFPDPANNHRQGICPLGWHVPNYAEYEAFSATLGGNSVAGAAIKETGTSHWNTPNTGATNSSGFTARAAGYRRTDGTFVNINMYNMYWTATPQSFSAYARRIFYNSTVFDYWLSGARNYGTSIRCFQD
jgi:uncharacterized protein (TIGR02145 family)/prepilin-type N-terminal cleavage/methylation domain-containing protein